mmetsp:Transcript_31709/g.37803  ORF Transcript_31709/g.37803 Transcript_31709/m.37803 type:complete len:93 (+) Transcript_31709:201-479(+)|eukprot:CAMPEP_0198250102 /NCGR_PEP_ID=MMETSP1447-20131203/1413_1 /TAXON_ID=420782 /ORGANISM="Chaetoceros dichaeta, Strain CCMP1751" /LENGTH=92 /DNA_ID=CAMNT_0043934881 /DNA_START=136 /DNA_END=414 /DNA_ORIENTATION=+
MRVATIIFALFLSSTQAFSITPSCSTIQSSASSSTRMFMSSPLDGMNREMLNSKDDDDVPMTKAEMKEAEKEMKAEMKRLKDEAAAAAKKEE